MLGIKNTTGEGSFRSLPGGKKAPQKGMRIIIVGCGKVGTTLIEQLSREGHDITIIDRSAKLVQR